MFINILIVLGVFLVFFVVVVALQPADFRISRSTSIVAPPADLFGQINDLRKFHTWNPWAKIDPAAVTTFDGPPAGVGSSMSWAGNHEVGEGMMTITETRPDELVRCKMAFKKPMQANHIAEFSLKPEGRYTVMTWSMSGTNGFLFKAMNLLMNCDKMVGSQFEKGLANLKALSENTGI